MLVGAAAYAEAYPIMQSGILHWGNFGKLTLPELFDLNHWAVIAFMFAVCIPLLRWLDSKFL